MRTASVADVETRLNSFLDQLDEEPVIITRDGKPIAALVSVSDQDDLERFARSRPASLRRLLEEANERITRTGGLTHEEFWKAVDEKYNDSDDATGAPSRGRRRAQR